MRAAQCRCTGAHTKMSRTRDTEGGVYVDAPTGSTGAQEGVHRLGSRHSLKADEGHGRLRGDLPGSRWGFAPAP